MNGCNKIYKIKIRDINIFKFNIYLYEIYTKTNIINANFIVSLILNIDENITDVKNSNDIILDL
jgi:hypothetical protein